MSDLLHLSQASDVGGLQWGVVLGASLAAALLDLRSRRIPNALTLPLLLAGVGVAVARGGLPDLGSSLGGCALLALPYLLLFAWGGGGAGDAKMMGAIGAWLGLWAGAVVLVAVAVVGGVFGLIGMVRDRQRRSRFGDWLVALYVFTMACASGGPGGSGPGPGVEEAGPGPGRRGMIPYGPAIFLGACLGAWVVRVWKL